MGSEIHISLISHLQDQLYKLPFSSHHGLDPSLVDAIVTLSQLLNEHGEEFSLADWVEKPMERRHFMPF